MWDLSSPTRDQTHTPALEGKVLTTGTIREVPSMYSFLRPQWVLQSITCHQEWGGPGNTITHCGAELRVERQCPTQPQEARGNSARNHGNTQHLRTSPPLPVYLLGTTFEIFSYSWFIVMVNSINFTLKWHPNPFSPQPQGLACVRIKAPRLTGLTQHKSSLWGIHIKNSTDNKCWQGRGETGTFLYYWWECKLV